MFRSCLTLLILAVATVAVADPVVDGSYTIQTPQGAQHLILESGPDGVTGTLQAQCDLVGVFEWDEDGEWFVEGTLECAAGGGEFELAFDAEDQTYEFTVVPETDDGELRWDQASVYVAIPGEPKESEPSSPSDSSPSPLVGLWSTQVNMRSANGSVITELYMEIRADGTLIDLGSRSLGGITGVSGDVSGGGGEHGEWRTNGDILEVRMAGTGWAPLARFQLSGQKLFFQYYDGDQAIWWRR